MSRGGRRLCLRSAHVCVAVLLTAVLISRQRSALGQPGDKPPLRVTAIVRSAEPEVVDPTEAALSRATGGLPARGSAVAGDGVEGTIVYENTAIGGALFFPRGSALFLADDVTLSQLAGCDMTYYELAVVGTGGGTFSVHVEVFDGDPCLDGNPIADTGADFIGLPADGTIRLIRQEFPQTVGIPGNIWLQAAFSSPDAGWVIGEQAETGFTDDVFAADGPGPTDCLLYRFRPLFSIYSGFWATIACDLEPRLPGACCDGLTCSQRLERDCEGLWRGPLTGCTPNPCGPRVTIYDNRFATGTFLPLASGTRVADDFRFTPGPLPCHAAQFEVVVTGRSNTPPFSATIELWANDRGLDGVESSDDLPLSPIADTLRTFDNIPADQLAHTLVAGPFPKGMLVSEKLWVVISTTSPDAGPLTAGLGDVGVSEDRYALKSGSGPWAGGQSFGGFNPRTCPGGAQCVPAGSFRARVVCFGEAASGACCAAGQAGCDDQVRISSCPGDWLADVSCVPDPFDPPCPAVECPTLGVVAFVDPPDGVVDARQPHPIDNSGTKKGIAVARLTAPIGAQAECFEFCESAPDGGANGIMQVTETAPGEFDLVFTRPITAMASSEVAYPALSARGRFRSHPANVNADDVADAADVVALMNCLLGVNATAFCPFGFPYSEDVDADGDFSLADLLAVVNLLNGAGDFAAYAGTALPEEPCP